MHGSCLDNDRQLNSFEDACADALCLLQSSVTVTSAQTSKKASVSSTSDSSRSLHRGDVPVQDFALLQKATDVHIDESIQILLGLFAFMVLAAAITVVCLLQVKHDGDEDPVLGGYLKQDDEKPVREGGSAMPSLNASFVVPPRTETVYYIPDISQHRRTAKSDFEIMDKDGKKVMGVLVKEGGEDPGILVHSVNPAKGGGAPVAFVDIHPDALRHGQLRIASPSSEHPRGKMYGILERVGESGFAVNCDGERVLWIENQSKQIRVLTAGMDGGREQQVGTSTRRGSQPIELHLQSNADGALAIICILAIQRME